ncbi:hypothetical protein ACFE04_022835 [Oxalis oulophora]
MAKRKSDSEDEQSKSLKETREKRNEGVRVDKYAHKPVVKDVQANYVFQRPIKKSIAVPTLMLRELRRKKLNHGQVVLAYDTESKKAFAILGEVSCILKTQNQLPKQLQNSKQSYCCCPSCCIFARINCQSSCKIANKVIVAAQAAAFLPERDNNNNYSHIFESRKNTHVCRRQYYNNPPTTHSNGAFEMTITLGVFSKNEEHISGAELEQMFSIITGTTEDKCSSFGCEFLFTKAALLRVTSIVFGISEIIMTAELQLLKTVSRLLTLK